MGMMVGQGALDFDGHQENLERVSSRLAPIIIQFCRERLGRADKTFHADELHARVLAETGISAPASADRILRDLRQKGNLGYKVRNRRASLYEVLWVKDDPPKEE